jgi:hypothetical protein
MLAPAHFDAVMPAMSLDATALGNIWRKTR